MAEKEDKHDVNEITNRLKEILNEVLATGDWKSSLFLKTSVAKLKKLRDKVENLFSNAAEEKVVDIAESKAMKEPAAGYIKVFILLYQVDGANLPGWYRTIKNLEEYNVTRPAYEVEDHAKEVIRSKVSNIERNGYVIANVKKEDVYEADDLDAFGHKLLSLKENAIDLISVLEFVHANKKRYALRDGELVLLDAV